MVFEHETPAQLAEKLRLGAPPGSTRARLADALQHIPTAARLKLVDDEPAPPPVAAHTMDVARYELRISEAQRTLLRTALQQSAMVARHRATDEEEIVELDEMLAAMEELPTSNDFTL